VLLRWSVQREIPVLAKSAHRDPIEANRRVFDFTLSDADVAALDSLDRTGGTDQTREGKWW
jgi:2,5-diketo-D-gluconate reductase A